MIFHFDSGFLNIASIAPHTKNHSPTPDPNPAAHTANPAPITAQELTVAGSNPMIWSAIISP